jgi:hypothetical protein
MRLWKSKPGKQNKVPVTPPPEKDYSTYVEHPRYGRSPRYTGLDIRPFSPGVTLHAKAVSGAEICRGLGESWAKLLGVEALKAQKETPRIPGTAILADPSRQNNPTYPATHYYDLERVCRDCKRPFIFFAEEQQHWYEGLQFPLDADCVRCPECRKKEQTLARKRRQFEQLSHLKDRDWKANLSMAECALTLVEQGIFHFRQTERVRALLKKVPEETRNDRYQDLELRLKRLLRERNPSNAKYPPASC